MKTILIQGAMDCETDILVESVKGLSGYDAIYECGQEFHSGIRGGQKIIVNVTDIGMVNAAMATAFALQRFRPDVVLNQGTAGAQTEDLSVGSLVVADEAVNINSFTMPKRGYGEGSNPFEWEASSTSCFSADKALSDFFFQYARGRYDGTVCRGRTATGDVYSRENDRIVWLRERFGTVCEEMESAAVFRVCECFGVPCAGLRVISNNELMDAEFDSGTARRLQKLVWRAVAGITGIPFA